MTILTDIVNSEFVKSSFQLGYNFAVFDQKKVDDGSNIAKLENFVSKYSSVYFDLSLFMRGAFKGALIGAPAGVFGAFGGALLGGYLNYAGTRLFLNGSKEIVTYLNDKVQDYSASLIEKGGYYSTAGKLFSSVGNFVQEFMVPVAMTGGVLSAPYMVGLSFISTLFKKIAQYKNSAGEQVFETGGEMNSVLRGLSVLSQLAMVGVSGYQSFGAARDFYNIRNGISPGVPSIIEQEPSAMSTQTLQTDGQEPAATLTPIYTATVTSLPEMTPTPTQTQVPSYNFSDADLNSFYGVSWGNADACDALNYSIHMGYQTVFYRDGMEYCGVSDDILSKIGFVLESPEINTNWKEIRSVTLDGQYSRDLGGNSTASDQNLIMHFFARSPENHDRPFPENLAKGFTGKISFTLQPDLQNPEVRQDLINHIEDKVTDLHYSGLNVIGFAWDVPDLRGDFWEGGRRVGLDTSYFPDGVIPPGFSETYSDGRAAFYNELFAQFVNDKMALTGDPDPLKIVIYEPTRTYIWADELSKWANSGNNNDINSILLDEKTLICQESDKLDFLNPSSPEPWSLSETCNSTPNIGTYADTQNIMGEVADKGAYFNWYGRLGELYDSIKDVPSQVKLARILPNWENQNGVSLDDRMWSNGEYSSPLSFANGNLIYSHQPFTDNIYAAFINPGASITLTSMPSSIVWTDALMGPSGDASGAFSITESNGNYILTPIDQSAFKNGIIIELNN